MTAHPAPIAEPAALLLPLLLAALCLTPLRAGSPDTFFPVERLEFIPANADTTPEGQQPSLLGGIESVYLEFTGITAGEAPAQNGQPPKLAEAVVASPPSGEEEPRTVKPPLGRWDTGGVFYAPTAAVLILTAADGARREAALFEPDGFAALGHFPLSFTRDPDAKIWIEGMRLMFPSGVPENLARFFRPEHALKNTGRFWKELAHPEHAELIASGVANLTSALPNEEDAKKNSAISAEGLRLSREALTAAARPLPPADELTGKWRVRTVVGSDLGVFLYPFFDARISKGEHPGELLFEKTTGSQRRAGVLFPTETPNALVFLGGKATDYEGSLVYSRFADPKAPAPAPSDTAGVFFLTDKNRALMVLDVSPAGAWEIYELRR